jgi:hypothetical protein
MDIECVNHQTNAPNKVATSHEHKVHMSLSLHKSASMQIIHPMYNTMHKAWIHSTAIQCRPMNIASLMFETKFKKRPMCINIHPIYNSSA